MIFQKLLRYFYPSLVVSMLAGCMTSARFERDVAAEMAKLDAKWAESVHTPSEDFSSFEEYDRRVIRCVQARWITIMRYIGSHSKRGHVTVAFALATDGTVLDLKIKERTAGLIDAHYCLKAIRDSAPFDPLPDHLRETANNSPRDVTFTFHY